MVLLIRWPILFIIHLSIILRNLYVNHAVLSGTGYISHILRFYVSSELVLAGFDLHFFPHKTKSLPQTVANGLSLQAQIAGNTGRIFDCFREVLHIFCVVYTVISSHFHVQNEEIVDYNDGSVVTSGQKISF